MGTNPYTAPRVSRNESKPRQPVSGLAVAGMAVAGILGALYLLVVVTSIYEILRVPQRLSIVGYVREGTFSAVFVIICAVTIRQLKERRKNARIWMATCPVLLLIFVYPGTHAVVSFFQNMIGL